MKWLNPITGSWKRLDKLATHRKNMKAYYERQKRLKKKR
jgi:hypothetical protein